MYRSFLIMITFLSCGATSPHVYYSYEFSKDPIAYCDNRSLIMASEIPSSLNTTSDFGIIGNMICLNTEPHKTRMPNGDIILGWTFPNSTCFAFVCVSSDVVADVVDWQPTFVESWHRTMRSPPSWGPAGVVESASSTRQSSYPRLHPFFWKLLDIRTCNLINYRTSFSISLFRGLVSLFTLRSHF